MEEKIRTLHEKAIEIAGRFHKAESDLIDILQKIDEQRVFMRLGFSSLFEYSLKALKLSEANASNFITVARKSKTIPELKMAVASGHITVSKARKITPVLTRENSSHWLELAKTLPKSKLEREVAKVMPQTQTVERAKYVSETRLEIKLGVSEDLMGKLRRAQDLTSQRTRKPATLEETLSEILEVYLRKQDPVERAKRNVMEKSDASASVPGTRYIPSKIKHRVHLRDEGRCTYVDHQGRRCENQRWLEIHHKVPLSHRGTNDPQNLQTLCSVHHRGQHKLQ